MQKVILCVGIPASGKSTWAKAEVAKNPDKTTRVCRDDLRNMMNNYVHSDSNEKMVTSVKEFTLLHALKKGHDVIIDECHANRRYFHETCNLIKTLNIDCTVMEKPFYVELEEALERNSKREGTGKIPEDVIKKFWKKLGGNQHKFYKPQIELITKNNISNIIANKPIIDPKLPWSIICDLDGTLSLFNSIGKNGIVTINHEDAHTRSPYDASKCHEDSLNEPVAAIVNTLFETGNYKIIFCSGREEAYRKQTEQFINKHMSCSSDYKLFMRKTGDQRKDSIIKEEIYKQSILGKYNVLFILDDRSSVVQFWRSIGLTCFQVAPGEF